MKRRCFQCRKKFKSRDLFKVIIKAPIKGRRRTMATLKMCEECITNGTAETIKAVVNSKLKKLEGRYGKKERKQK